MSLSPGNKPRGGPAGSTRRAPCAYLKTLYFNTLVYYAGTLDFLRRKVGAEHLLLGNDFAYVLGDWQCVDTIETLSFLATEKQMILAGNAKSLLDI